MAAFIAKEELNCSICLSIYTDPVTLSCGHIFCLVCIENTWDRQENGECSCPECRHVFTGRPTLEKNIELCTAVEHFLSAQSKQEAIEIFCTYCVQSPSPAVKTCLHCEASLCDLHLTAHNKSEEHVLSEPITNLKNRKCPIHKKLLEYFCLKDEVCVCVSCCLVGEHKGHQVELLNEASDKKKERQKNVLGKLISKREETESRFQILKEPGIKVPEKSAAVTERAAALFRDIRKRVADLETQFLSEISRQEQQVSLQVSGLIQQMEIKKNELSRKICHIEELSNITDPLMVLQGQESDGTEVCDVEDIEEEDKFLLAGNLDEFMISLTLQKSLQILADVLPSMGPQRGFNVAPLSGIYFDVNATTNNKIDLSHDMKTITYNGGRRHQDNPEKFLFCQILSASSFSYGQHYWEIEKSQSGDLRIGFTYSSKKMERKKAFLNLIGYNNKSWCLRSFNRDFSAIHDSEKKPVLSDYPYDHRLGIFLDYEAGRLSFYLLCDPVRHLHTFTATFTGPLHAAFYVYDGWVRICD